MCFQKIRKKLEKKLEVRRNSVLTSSENKQSIWPFLRDSRPYVRDAETRRSRQTRTSGSFGPSSSRRSSIACSLNSTTDTYVYASFLSNVWLIFGKSWEARSRLYQSRFFANHTCLKALEEIYKITHFGFQLLHLLNPIWNPWKALLASVAPLRIQNFS